MKKSIVVFGLFLLLAGCSDDATEATPSGAAGQPSAGTGGTDAGGSSSGGTDAGGTDAGGTDAGGTDAGGTDAGGSGGSGQAGSGGGTTCTEALNSLLGPVDKVSEGEVVVVKEEGGVKMIYVDASAGGQQAAPENPRVYIELATGKRVDASDPQASASADWDLSLKRAVIFSNSGDAGPGQGGAVFLEGKSFEQVTSGDAAALSTEAFVSEDCIPSLDETQTVKTTFSGWYDYNETTHQLSPKAGVFLVKGAGGSLYKVEIVGYYGKPDGALDGMAGGRYILRVAGL